jgi:glucose-1-phosphate thymidylyltransferase
MKAVILAAGEGTRLEPLTEARPKPMVPVANRPLLEYVIEAVRDAGISQIVLVVGYKRERIQNHFGDGDDWGVDVEYVVQDKQLGTGHAILQAEPAIDGPFLALNGDRILDTSDIGRLMARAEATDGPIVSVVQSENPSRYGVVETAGDRVQSIVEKPLARDVRSTFINAGAYAFDRGIFEAIRATSTRGELSITATLSALADDDEIRAIRFEGIWLDVSNLWDLLTVNKRVLDRLDPAEATDDSHERAVVHDSVTIDDDVRLRAGAVLLPGTAIGRNVDVGANAVIKNSVVFPDATIGDGAVIRDSIVGANTTVGSNGTFEGGRTDMLSNGELHRRVRFGGVVGDNSHLNGGVSVEPGTVIGNDVHAGTGVSIGGEIESGSLVRRG